MKENKRTGYVADFTVYRVFSDDGELIEEFELEQQADEYLKEWENGEHD